MIIDIIQSSNELFSAEFKIKREATIIGGFSLLGKITSMEADMQYDIINEQYKMQFNKRLKSKESFRPYSIYRFDNEVGNVFEAEYKASFFKGYSFNQLNYGDGIYKMYGIGLGKEGYKFPIYCNGEQVAQIEMGCVVKDGLYEYKAFIKDESFLNAVIFLCGYSYVTGPYVPGEKVTHSTEKSVLITTNKLLKEKYNPDFVKGIEK